MPGVVQGPGADPLAIDVELAGGQHNVTGEDVGDDVMCASHHQHGTILQHVGREGVTSVAQVALGHPLHQAFPQSSRY